MFAYVFWHVKPAGLAVDEYEAALCRFQEELRSRKFSGILGNFSYSIDAVPWLGEAGYEDWVVAEDLSVLERLNTLAVTGPMEESHAAIAHMTKHGGFGGLYYLVSGARQALTDSTVAWLARPRGVKWADAMPGIVETAGAEVAVWRRFMVLGPAPEFAVIGPKGLRLALPEGWSSLAVSRRKVCG